MFGKRNLTWSWDTSVQGNLATGTDPRADAWAFRFGGVIDHNNPSAFVTQVELENQIYELIKERVYSVNDAVAEVHGRHSVENASFYKGSWWSFAGKLEADRDFDNQRLSFELMMTPTTSLPGNGILLPSVKANEDAPLRLIWRPYFGIDAGKQIESDGSIDQVDDKLRGIGRLTAGISLDSLAKALGLPEVGLNTDNTTNYLASSNDSYNYLDTQLVFKFNDNVGFSLKYVNGEKPPNFKDVEAFGGVFTVKF